MRIEPIVETTVPFHPSIFPGGSAVAIDEVSDNFSLPVTEIQSGIKRINSSHAQSCIKLEDAARRDPRKRHEVRPG